MLSEYSKYLESIRDSLVQCGVAFPSIEPISSLEYSRVFNLGEELCSLMYFYDIMVCSGNMDGIFLPSDRSYLNNIRVESFKEFSEDILPTLKEQLGDSTENFISELFLDESEPEEPEEWVNEEVSPEDMIFDAEELFGDDDESVTETEFELSGGSMWDIEESNQPDSKTLPEDILEYEENSGVSIFGEVGGGTELFNLGSSESHDMVGSEPIELEYATHGTELFSIQIQDATSEEEYEWGTHGTELFSVSEPTSEEECEWSTHGTELFSVNVGTHKTEEPLWKEPDEESSEGMSWEEDDSEEQLWEEPDEETIESISWEEDEPEEQTSSDGFVWEDPDEEDNSVSGISWEDEEPFNPTHSIRGGSEERVGGSNNSPSSSSKVLNGNKDSASMGTASVGIPKEERDIVDTVQDAASSALTSAKRFITRLAKSYE